MQGGGGLDHVYVELIDFPSALFSRGLLIWEGPGRGKACNVRGRIIDNTQNLVKEIYE